MRTQVTFDCADPHALAGFWAQVFGSVVEDHSALVDHRDHGPTTHVLRDPEGNEFCLH
jgi:hypothetical protein